jgi:NTP pyrophosphatase (non-canonical NTP hydrolase)
MNFQEYTEEASKTAFYPAQVNDFRLAYLALKMNGETGELVEALTEFNLYDGEKANLTVPKILKEAGDLLWYTSQAAKLIHYIPKSFGFTDYFSDNKYSIYNYVDLLENSTNSIAEYVGKIYRDEDGFLDTSSYLGILGLMIDRILRALAYIAKTFDTSLEVIAKMNLEKLTSRMKRGKLGGSGDDR